MDMDGVRISTVAFVALVERAAAGYPGWAALGCDRYEAENEGDTNVALSASTYTTASMSTTAVTPGARLLSVARSKGEPAPPGPFPALASPATGSPATFAENTVTLSICTRSMR